MVEIKDFDHHTSTVLTYAGPTPNTHLNSHHDLTFRTKEMNAESTGNMSVDEDPSGKRLGESGMIAFRFSSVCVRAGTLTDSAT